MVTLTQNATSEKVVLTLTEKVTLTNPFFMFVFTHVTTKAEVTFNRSYGDDSSKDRERCNIFEVDTSALFVGKDSGQWHYEVYESTDGETRGGLLENGKMILNKATSVTVTGYSTKPTYSGYAG